jgi:hypothetical protein
VAWLTYQMAVVTNASGAIIGQALFGSPLKWVLVLAPLGLVFFLQLPHRAHASLDGTADVLRLCRVTRGVARDHLHGLHPCLDPKGLNS